MPIRVQSAYHCSRPRRRWSTCDQGSFSTACDAWSARSCSVATSTAQPRAVCSGSARLQHGVFFNAAKPSRRHARRPSVQGSLQVGKRDCTHASCVLWKRAVSTWCEPPCGCRRGTRKPWQAQHRSRSTRRQRELRGAALLLVAELARQAHLRRQRDGRCGQSSWAHQQRCTSQVRHTRHAVQLVHVAQRREHGVVLGAPLAREEAGRAARRRFGCTAPT
jgi:hypothetical protein